MPSLLGPTDVDRLREALVDYTVDGVDTLLGPIGRAAHSRGDLGGVARAIRGADDLRLATLVTLFLLGDEVDAGRARAALSPWSIEAARATGVVETSAGAVRARLDLRPYAETTAGAGDAPWWVVSDFGADVRPGRLAADHVLGIGAAGLTLAQATPRDAVTTALDVGTGCGVQALHLSRHAAAVTATDVSPRALRMAATTAALSGQDWTLREGSLLEPVAGDRFDLVVANPPFVVSPAIGGHDYRDSGLPGDEVCRSLVGRLPSVLAPGGTGQLLANWIIPVEGSWQERVAGWFEGSDCDAWVWQREVADPGEYVALWLHDAGGTPGTAQWRADYDSWLDWFVRHGVAAIGMGMITMWRSRASSVGDPIRVLEDVPQAYERPVGPQLTNWLSRRRWLAGHRDDALLGAALRPDEDLVRTTQDVLGDDGWISRRTTLRQSHGFRWEIEVDDAVASVVAACAVGATPRLAVEVLAASTGADAEDMADALAPVLRDLVARGVLLPPSSDLGGPL